MNKAVVAIVVVVILIIGGLALANKDNNKTNTPASSTNTNSSSQTNNAADNNANNSAAQTEGTITYSANGFSPDTLTVKAGATITIKNTSSSAVDFESDPHPQHTDNPELNAGTVGSGQSKTFTVTTKGNWGYHNHLNPGDTGTIIVQ